MNAPTINAQHLMHGITLTVTGLRGLRWRLRIGTRLIMIGARVMGCGIRFEPPDVNCAGRLFKNSDHEGKTKRWRSPWRRQA